MLRRQSTAELDWLDCADPLALLDLIPHGLRYWRANDRTLRLIGHAIWETFRRSSHINSLPRFEDLVRDNLAFIDGKVGQRLLQTSFSWALQEQPASYFVRRCINLYVRPGRRPTKTKLTPLEACDLIREVMGNPWLPFPQARWPCPFCKDDPQFRASGTCVNCRGEDETFAPWLTRDVRSVAATIYRERSFGDVFALADLLEDVSCPYPDVVEHLRSPEAVHVRGCWVIDTLIENSW